MSDAFDATIDAQRRMELKQSRHEEVIVHDYPDCDFCKKECEDGAKTPRKAKYDGKTNVVGGSWAYMCQEHFDVYGVGLGLGRGQRLLVLR